MKGEAALVGVAESDLGEVGPGLTPLDLIAQATLRALDDAGLEKGDVDGLFSSSAYYFMPTLSIGEYLGIRPRYSDATSVGGSSFVSHLFHAAAAINAGLCEVALIAFALRGALPPALPREHVRPRCVAAYARVWHHQGTTRRGRRGGAGVGEV